MSNAHPLTGDLIEMHRRAPWTYELSQHHKFLQDDTTMWEGVPTMSCDSETVRYHSATLKWPKEKRIGTLLHEFMHTGNQHHARGKGIPDHLWPLWNRACDAVINPPIKLWGFDVSDGVFIPGAEGKSAEQVFSELLKDQKKQPQPQPGPGKPGPMARPPAGQPKPGDGDGDGDGEGDGKGKPCNVQASAVEKRAEMDAVMARMVSAAKAAGKGSAGLEQAVKRWLEPKVDWRAVLKDYCTRLNKDGWSYERTNSSYRAMGIYVPGRRSKALGTVVIVRDTSGSLVNKQTEIATEAFKILSEMRPEKTIIIDADDSVHRVLELGPGDEMPDKAMGGGGTDFRPAFDKIEELGIQPDIMVFITDLCGEFPADAPMYPVIWALIDSGSENPPWGMTVEIER